jgi:hypothetical protein
LSNFFSNFHSQISLFLRICIDEASVAHHSAQTPVSKSLLLLFPGVRIFLRQQIRKIRTLSKEISTLLIASYTLFPENHARGCSRVGNGGSKLDHRSFF